MQGEEQILQISDLSHDGRGIAFTPERLAIFVPDALPGQVVKCRTSKKHRNFCEASLLSIISSPPLAEPFCPHFQTCGGCPLQTLPQESQLYWKENLLKNSLTRIGKMPPQLLEKVWQNIAQSPRLTEFRNKLTLAFGHMGGEHILGLRARKSHDILPVTCRLLPGFPKHILADLGELLNGADLPPGVPRFLTLRHARTLADPISGWHLLLLTGRTTRAHQKKIGKIFEKLLANHAGLLSIRHDVRHANDLLAKGDREILTLSKSESPQALSLQGKLFALDTGAFFQVNSGAAEILAKSVVEMTGDQDGELLDLYCGVGSPGQLLPGFASSIGLEYSPGAVKWAKFNAERHALPNWHYKSGNAEKNFGKMKKRLATVLADPPRQGLQAGILRGLLEEKPEKIVYVSCNPATLGRDAAKLSEAYDLKMLQPIDMFPHTPHVETCTLWTRKAAS